jgi:hypothetical protein
MTVTGESYSTLDEVWSPLPSILPQASSLAGLFCGCEVREDYHKPAIRAGYPRSYLCIQTRFPLLLDSNNTVRAAKA